MRPGRVLAVVVSALALAAPASAAGDARPPTVEWRLRDWGGAWRLELRLSERASVAAALTRGGELVRRVPVRPLQAGRARLGLGRLAGGAYRLRVVARDPAGAQTAVERAVRLPALVTVAVSGDLLIHTPVAARALYNGGRRGYRFGPMLARIGPLVRRADLALCHVEHPVGRGPPSGYPRFRAPAALAGAIRSAGFDVCSTASNHTLDYGQPGVDATLGALDRAGVRHTGSWARPPPGRPALLRARGVTVGFVAATEHTNGIARPHPWSVALADPGAILAAARRARRDGADAVVVNLHWGAEYRHGPTPFQWRLARRLTASPAVTAVVGQHAHVVQPIRFVNRKPVVFGEGNLVSNQSGASQDGLVALLDLAVTPRHTRVRGCGTCPPTSAARTTSSCPPPAPRGAAPSRWRGGRRGCGRSAPGELRRALLAERGLALAHVVRRVRALAPAPRGLLDVGRGEPSDSARTTARVPATASGAPAATSLTAARAAPQSPAGSTTWSTSPTARASSASIGAPVRNIRRVRPGPIAATNRRRPSAVYTTPNLVAGIASRAPAPAIRQSQAIASSRAPPAAAPFTTPITGIGQSATAATAAPSRRSPARMRSMGSPSPPTSSPAEKWRSPSPPRSTARAAGGGA